MICTDLANRNRPARRQIVGASSRLQPTAQASDGVCPRRIFMEKMSLAVFIVFSFLFSVRVAAQEIGNVNATLRSRVRSTSPDLSLGFGRKENEACNADNTLNRAAMLSWR